MTSANTEYTDTRNSFLPPTKTTRLSPLTLSPEQLERIKQATTFQELARIRRELLDLEPLKSIKRAGELAPLVVVVNLIQDNLIRQGVALSVRELEKKGWGSPPFPFAFLQFGSGGRSEQAIVSDQDNGLIYELPEYLNDAEKERVEGYFHLLGATIVQGLEITGYPPCHGNVTCVSRRWRGSIAHWLEMLESWTADPSWENARYLLLASDVRVLCGETSLLAPVREKFRLLLTENPHLINRLVSNTLYYRVPLGLFGRVLPEVQGRYRGAVNLKYGVYLPIVNCVRQFALAHGIFASSTLERLAQLRERGIWSPAFCDEVESHFRPLLGLRLVTPLHWPGDRYASLSYIKLKEMSPSTTSFARSAMKLAIRLQRMTAKLPTVFEG